MTNRMEEFGGLQVSGTAEEGRTVCWPIGDLPLHAFAVGAAGSGKTGHVLEGSQDGGQR